MAGLGGATTLAVIGIVVWEAFQPDISQGLTAAIVEVQHAGSGYVAEVRVTNDGLDTAAAVDIEGALGEEVATATIDYVPGRGHAEAYLAFSGDPTTAEVAVLGWSKP